MVAATDLREFNLWRSPPLRALTLAELVSVIGSQMTWVAIPWFVLTTTGSPGRMGLVMAAELAPVALFGALGGTAVDRLGARRTMLVSDLARAALMVAVPLLYWSDVLSFPMLLIAVALLGSFLTPHMAAQRVIIPTVVGEDEVTVSKANAVLQGAQRLGTFVGPALGGVLVAVLEPITVLVVDAATFVVAFVIVLRWIPATELAEPEAGDGGVWEGLRHIMANPLLRGIIGGLAVGEMAIQALVLSLPVAVIERFDGDPRWVGAFIGGFGAGATLGVVAVIPILSRVPGLLLGGAALAGMGAAPWVFPLGLPAWGVVGAMATLGILGSLSHAPLVGILTVRVPSALRGRVMAGALSLILVAGPFGLVAAGPLIERFGLDPMLTAVAALATIGYGVAAAVAIRTWRAEAASFPAVV